MNNPAVVVFAPSPLLTITVELPGGTHREIHLHAGGQGFWVARMVALLGVHATLCCALGGESGTVLRALILQENVRLRAVDCAASNGVYVHARRGTRREEIARTNCRGLSRHEVDELYGAVLSSALDAPVAMLTGVDPEEVLESDIYRRLARDLRSNGVKVIADLSGDPLQATLSGGLDLVKISDEQLLEMGIVRSETPEELLGALDQLHAMGAETVLVSRAGAPTLVFDGEAGRYLQLEGPKVEALEPHGTGDSMFAALGASLAAGRDLEGALRLAMAAGCLNATRRGLGTGSRREIEQLSRHIQIAPLNR